MHPAAVTGFVVFCFVEVKRVVLKMRCYDRLLDRAIHKASLTDGANIRCGLNFRF
jgi:hypothetical protein